MCRARAECLSIDLYVHVFAEDMSNPCRIDDKMAAASRALAKKIEASRKHRQKGRSLKGADQSLWMRCLLGRCMMSGVATTSATLQRRRRRVEQGPPLARRGAAPRPASGAGLERGLPAHVSAAAASPLRQVRREPVA